MLHVYIHIPFCQSKCPYCSFGSVTDYKLINDYFNALQIQFKHFLDLNTSPISTIFIGGGTPNTINEKFYEIIFKNFTNLTKDCEITVEANPNKFSNKWIKEMVNFGVNRISFGAQSFNQSKLKLLGRIHSVDDIFFAVDTCKNLGLENINVDFIYATKFDDTKFIKSELENISKLNINHVSAYSLTLEKNTPFFNKTNYTKNDIKAVKYLFKGLENFGFKQYEISNFGKICKHNLSYWEYQNYYGFGAFSVGFNKNKRFYSPKDINSYIKNPIYQEVELLTNDDIKLEKIFMGLRSIVGIKKDILSEKELQNIKILVKENLLKSDGEKFYCNNFLLADEIALFITRQNL